MVLNFPLSDLSQTKRRPAFGLAAVEGDDLILCQITSQAREDGYSVRLEGSDFVNGGLNQSSRIRPNRLLTADPGIVLHRAGQVSPDKLNETITKLSAILDAN